jgi:hypothetical protein
MTRPRLNREFNMAAPSTPRSTPTGSGKQGESSPERTEAGEPQGGKPQPAGAAPASESGAQEGRQESATPAPQPAASMAASSPPPSPQAPSGDQAGAFATEKPVIPPAAARTSTYVVTVDNRTGIATRIERLDEKSGERKEMSPMEYAQLAAAYYAPATADGGVLMQAYLQGMKDYFGAQPRAPE